MDKQSTLGILELNRRDIQRNLHFALTLLEKLNEAHAHDTDPDVQLSLQLSNSLAQFYFHANYNASIDISSAVVERFGAAGSVSFVVMHLNLMGAAYTVLKKHKEAGECYNRALSLAGNEPNFAHLLVNIYQQMTESSIKTDDLETALAHAEKSLEILTQFPRPVLLYRVYLQMGNIYCGKSEFEKAMTFFNKALQGFTEDFELLLMSLTYISMGKCSLMNDDLDLAKKYLLEGLQLGDKAGQPENCALNNLYLAQVYQREKNMEEAAKYASMALHLARQIDDSALIANVEKIMAHTAA